MAYFKIEKSGCCEHNGLCQVRADFYWDEKDKEYALTPCKIIPAEGYSGKVDSNGIPLNIEDYNAWFDALPTEDKLLPFHIHFIYFESYHTDEEILFCFELALDWRVKNKPMKNVRPVWKENHKANSETRIAEILTKDFATKKTIGNYSVK